MSHSKMKIFVSPVTKKNIDAVIHSILPYEQTCINLTECLKRQKQFFDKGNNSFAFIKAVVFSSERTTIGVLVLSASNVLLHSFIKKIPECVYGYIATSFFKDIAPLSIMGEKEMSLTLERIIEKVFFQKPKRVEDYKLLILKEVPKINFVQKLKNNFNLEFIKASASDIKNLYPLEEAYQEEEVLPKQQKASFDLCFKILSKRIDAKLLYAVKKGNGFIAKAAVNASGFFWNQIGGVYTVKKFRNKGIGAAVVFFLVEDCLKNRKKCALFVKLKNYAARKMYSNIGFTEYCDFRISYF